MSTWPIKKSLLRRLLTASVAATISASGLIGLPAATAASTPFVLSIDLVSSNPIFEIPIDYDVSSTCTVDMDVDWGDGTSLESFSSTGTRPIHTYSNLQGLVLNPRTVTVTIKSNHTCGWIRGNASTYNVVRVLSWGGKVTEGDWVTSLAAGFQDAFRLVEVPATLPPNVTDMSDLFAYAPSFNQDIGSWNTSNIQNMQGMFESARSFNQDLPWNTSNVTDMSGMFNGADSFNGNIGSWDTSSVTNMSRMFRNSDVFNGNISSWVTSSVTTMANMFSGAESFNQDLPWNTSNVTDMSNMFNGAIDFNGNIGSWDTSSVTNMSGMFMSAPSFNGNIGSWDTSGVSNMSEMFRDADSFSQDLPWNTSNVTDMSEMFRNSDVFNGNISSWVTSSVTNMAMMFRDAESFNQDLPWNTSNVTDMSWMFEDAHDFNGNIGSWVTSSVTNFSKMFSGAESFNQDLPWNTSDVTDMSEMFRGATAFNGNIGSWNTYLVTNMDYMFSEATAFNQDIGGWDTSSVNNMESMFENATAFTQDIGGWDVSAVSDLQFMFEGASSFNQDLSNWTVSNVQDFSRTFYNSPMGYCLGWSSQIANPNSVYYGVANSTFAPAYDESNCITVNLNPQNGDPARFFSYQAANYDLPEQPAPTRSGFSFVGWAVSPAATAAKTFPIASAELVRGMTLYGIWSSGTFVAPAPATYSGPVVNFPAGNTGAPSVQAGDAVSFEIKNLNSLVALIVGGVEVEVRSLGGDRFEFTLPAGLLAGLQDVVLVSDAGRLTVQDALFVLAAGFDATEPACEAGPAVWTKRLSAEEAKVYIKCGEIGTSYRIQVQDAVTGEYRTVITRTLASEGDDRQVFNENGRYLIRTLEIKDRLRIRVLAGDEIVRQNVYNQ